MYSESTGNSNGAGDFIFAGSTAIGDDRRALLQFDLSSIPNCATIDSAVLTLSCNRVPTTTGYAMSIHRVTASWGEESSDAPGNEGGGTTAATGDATWASRFHSATAWTSSGGDYIGTATATTTVGGTGSYSWRGANVTTEIENWLDGTNANNGWILIGDESTTGTAKRFGSRDNGTAANRPQLIVYYTDYSGIVINEVNYDDGGTDTFEFVELYNGSAAAINLDDLTLTMVNGSTTTTYRTVDLPNISLAASDYYVICGNSSVVPNCDLVVSPSTNLIQNGAPDAMALELGTAQCDALSYEGSVTGYVETSGAGLEDNAGNYYQSLNRYPDGKDNDSNNVDFIQSCASPGLANLNTTGGCVVLPVNWMGVYVYEDGGETFIKWETASELNNFGYNVQHSRDLAEGFDNVGFVEGNGTTVQKSTYVFNLGKLANGVHHFRLEQVDYDGKIAYSKVISLLKEGAAEDEVYIDNPIKSVGQMFIRPAIRQHVTVNLYDLNGKLMKVIFAGAVNETTGITINASTYGLTSGAYIIEVKGDFFRKAQQVVLVK